MAMDRVALDNTLFAEARRSGAEVKTGLSVTEMLTDNGQAAGVVTREEGRHSARMVVGADGLRSVVMRRLGLLRRGPRLKKVGLTGHVRGSTQSPEIGELHLFAWGCAGVVQIDPTTVNAVLVLNSPFTRRASGDPRRCFDDLIGSVPTLAGGIRVGEVHATGPFDYPARNVVSDGALLVGDAAGYYDPFTGEGIYRALRGARIAAEVIDRCLERGDCSANALGPYAKMHRLAFDGGVRRQKAIEAVVSRPRWLQAAAIGMSRAGWAADRLVSMVGDVPPANRHGQPSQRFSA
jgi:flavin-dependent dehydrogenase